MEKQPVDDSRRRFLQGLIGLAGSAMLPKKVLANEPGPYDSNYPPDPHDVYKQEGEPLTQEATKFAEDFYRENKSFFELMTTCKNDDFSEFRKLSSSDQEKIDSANTFLKFLEDNIVETLSKDSSFGFPRHPFHTLITSRLKKLREEQNVKEDIARSYQRLLKKENLESKETLLAINKFLEIAKKLNEVLKQVENKESSEYLNIIRRYSIVALNQPPSNEIDYCAS